MSTKTTILINKAAETVGTVSFDENARSWRLACQSRAEFPTHVCARARGVLFLVFEVRPAERQTAALERQP
jgi:hypothetical protein